MIPGTWSHAAMVALALFIVVCVAICFWPRKRNRRTRPVTTPPTVDYSAQRARALKQLGDDYLLARPINRNHNTKTVLQ